jgi:hypothetical protein
MKEADMGRTDKTHGREETHTECWKEKRVHLIDLVIGGECSIKMSIKEIIWEGGD